MKGILLTAFLFAQYICFSQCHTGSVSTNTATASSSGGQVTVSWNAVSPVGDGTVSNVSIQYNVLYMAGVGTPSLGGAGVTATPGTGGTSATISGLALGTTYSFRILISTYCSNVIDPSSPYSYQFYSNTVSSATTVPGVPTLAGGTPASASSISISWNAVTGAASYDYEVSNTSGTVVASGNIAGSSLTVGGLSSNTNYYYRVRARNASGVSGFSGNSGAILTLPDAPAFPATSATAITTTSFRVNWNSVAGGSSYRLEVSADPNFNTFVTNPSPLVVAGTTSPDITGLLGATTYYYRVRAVNSLGGTSANSTRNQTLTAPVTPVGFSVGSTTSTSMGVNWTASTTATAYELTVAGDPNFNFPIAGYSPKSVAAPFIFDQVSGLSPSVTYYLRIRAKNGASAFSDYAYTSAQTRPPGGGGGLTLTTSIPASHTTGEVHDIVVEAVNGTAPVTIKLFHRKNSEADYATEPIPLASGNMYKIAVKDAWLDNFGMELYFVATDANNPHFEKTAENNKPFKIVTSVPNVTVPVESFGSDVKNYQIISFPYHVKDRLQVSDMFEQVMGSYDKKRWRLFQYKDGKNVEYSEGIGASDLEQGKAYWFISKDKVELSFGKGQSYGNALSDDQPFKIALKKGWNQIGNPFPHNLSWSDIQAANPGLGKLNVFNKSTVSFAEGNLLTTFGGGFVFADEARDLSFPITLPAKGGRKTTLPPDDLPEGNDWNLPIQLVQGEVTNTLSGIGMRAKASAGKDTFDKVTTPRFLRYLEFNSKKENYEFTLSTDIVNTADHYRWDFSIESDSDEPAELRWDSETVSALGAPLILYDQTKQVLIDMTGTNAYSTFAGAKISLYYGNESLSGSEYISLGKPYPNPFQTDVVLPYNYSSSESVQAELVIYDLSGRVVMQKSVHTPVHASGLQSVRWDGATQTGDQASPGFYLFKMRVNKGSETVTFDGKIIKK